MSFKRPPNDSDFDFPDDNLELNLFMMGFCF